jgi:hypothetical protein
MGGFSEATGRKQVKASSQYSFVADTNALL